MAMFPSPATSGPATEAAAASIGSDRIMPMEGIRGYAVFLVFLVHHHTLFGGYLASQSFAFHISQFSHAIGNSGVDFFFVLSGFLIYGNLLRKQIPYRTFIKKRIRRLYPTFLFVFGLYIVLSHLAVSPSKLPQEPFSEIVYLLKNVVFLPGIFNINPLVTVTWSLSYEFFFYLSIPLLITFTGMRAWRRSRRIIFFTSLLLLHWIGYGFEFLPHIRLSMFVTGILLFEVFDSRVIHNRLAPGLEWAAIGMYCAVMAALGMSHIESKNIAADRSVPLAWTILLGISLPLIVMYSVRCKGVLSRIFCVTPLLRLGNISYSYFLIHGLVLNAIAFAVRPVAPDRISAPLFLIFLVTNFALTVFTGATLFQLIERPYSHAIPAGRRLTIATGTVGGVAEGQHKASGGGVA